MSVSRVRHAPTAVGGWLWPAVCVGVGAGLITIRNETTSAAGARAFGLVGGICLFALAGLSVIVSLRKRRRREAAGPGTTVLASTPAPARLTPAGTRAATADRSDPLATIATIAKLAQLRDTGALTEDEFQIQKAKLLAELSPGSRYGPELGQRLTDPGDGNPLAHLHGDVPLASAVDGG